MSKRTIIVTTKTETLRGEVETTLSRATCVKRIADALGLTVHRTIDRKGYARGLSKVGSLDSGWFNIEVV